MAAQIFMGGGDVCNFLIHPSVKISEHEKFAEKIGGYLNELFSSYEEDETKETFESMYREILDNKDDLYPFEKLYDFIIDKLKNDQINVLVLNSLSSYEDNSKYEKGINVLIGGNSLGRGVTFPKLQTIYYCRVSKNPQADTMWQHARMFGYDRDPKLMRVYMPPKLYKLFSDINTTNDNIVNQIENLNEGNDIRIVYPVGLRPTRKNVLDNKTLGVFCGGVNYFPFYPSNNSIEDIDGLLSKFPDGDYSVSINLFCKILEHTDSELDDWSARVFIGFLKSLIADNPLAQGRLIVRRNRDIAKGTGTLLSPNDRKLGDDYKEEAVLTLYKVTGKKGWGDKQLWIPNIKLPGDNVYYCSE